jgi:CRP-like cAMP-binding protein
MGDIESIIDLLERVIPFRFLRREEQRELAAELEGHDFPEDSLIIRQGDPQDRRVYLLDSGSVEVIDRQSVSARVDIIETGHYFGEWEPLFKVPRSYEIRAREPSVCYSLSGDRFLGLLEESRPFAQGMSVILRDRQDVFAAFTRFRAELLGGTTTGSIAVERLLPLYRRLEPALHPYATDPHHIDYGALTYAVRRLPENLTRTLAFLLTDEIPAAVGSANEYFPAVATEARRRDMWEMLPGKNLVLLRNGESDLVDLVTNLCLYATEAEKIRRRLNRREYFRRLARYEESEGARRLLSDLDFGESEVESILAIWGEQAPARLYELVRHREMFNVDLRRQTLNYNSRRAELWTAQIGEACKELLGFDPGALPLERRVHIISSNTHSVSNCLNPWYRDHHSEICEWGEEIRHPFTQESWNDPFDLAYALARDYFQAHPYRAEESKQVGAEHGILRLETTASTGIQVQLVDASKLAGEALDPKIPRLADGNADLIVNIDYAFGEQAEHVIRNLLMLFGENVSSIAFLGKAGALTGKRGDVLVPTAFIQQENDQFLPMERSPNALDFSDLLSDREIHSGPMLTVGGTLLQNRKMLHFYRHMWNCVGIEMEGAHYRRQVLESSQLGVVSEDVELSAYYYVSDLPLAGDATLSARLRAAEGVPPLYAITRKVLGNLFGKQ